MTSYHDLLYGTAERDRLVKMLERVQYKPGWVLELRDCTLVITVRTIDSRQPEAGLPTVVQHLRPVPPGVLQRDERRQVAWLFEECMAVERHEASEFFRVDGVAPFWPH